MSRIGKLPIEIPSGVKVAINGQEVRVEGPKGVLSRVLMTGATLTVEEKQLSVTRTDDSIPSGLHMAWQELSSIIWLSVLLKGLKELWRLMGSAIVPRLRAMCLT